ncbi:hypothetical protein [Paenibacillus sp. IITD108]|uniref:hypothetical protein n=1 Tax=Paenibacillus sp. IITD108 TaxID=3116649 RepID=UPI002F41BDE0
MGKRKGREQHSEEGKEIEIFSFDDDEEEVFIDYVCVDCGCLDPVPDFIVGECSYGLEPGESPVFVCPECNGDLVRKGKPAEE